MGLSEDNGSMGTGFIILDKPTVTGVHQSGPYRGGASVDTDCTWDDYFPVQGQVSHMLVLNEGVDDLTTGLPDLGRTI